MALLAGLSILAHILVSAVMGLRLLWVARGTRGLEEATIGAAFTCLTLLGYPLVIASGFGRLPLGETFPILYVIGSAFLDLGVLFVFLFTWKVFRPDSVWARAGVCAAAAALCVHVAATWLVPRGVDPATPTAIVMGSWSYLITGGLALSFGWSGLESLFYYQRIRRRSALGLAEPIVANRFLLWSLSGIAATLMNVGSMGANVYGMSVFNSTPVAIWTSATGLVSACTLYLAILPTRRYAAWIEARHLAAAAPSV